MSEEMEASKTPKGSATDLGSFIHDGSFPLMYSMLLALAPTYTRMLIMKQFRI